MASGVGAAGIGAGFFQNMGVWQGDKQAIVPYSKAFYAYSAMQPSFLWHDYETSGADPKRDRPTQFAAIRTDENLEPIGEPIELFCKPSMDVLPTPTAALITGISPQRCERLGLPEPEFARQINAAFSVTGTCGVGYNSIRFDDEVTRNLLYRNFFDPYEREWRGGNSRWDLLDVLRLAHALRPQGIIWPQREDGATSFRLEALAAANGLAHEQAHDALSDVRATIALARLLKQQQARLWAHALRMRDKRYVASLIDTHTLTPLLHVSAKIPAQKGCLAVVAPIAWHPSNSNQVITFDLQQDAEELLSISLDDLADRVFAAEADLPEGLARIAVKGIHTNKSPMLAPLKTLDAASAQRWGVDLQRVEANRQILLAAKGALAEKLRALFAANSYEPEDPELAIYGGFASAADKKLCVEVQRSAPEASAHCQGRFQDARYNALLLRYRARHAPWSLSDDEQTEWRQFVQQKLSFETGLASITLPAYQAELAVLIPQAKDLSQLSLLQELQAWPMDSGLLDLLREAQ